MIWKLHVIPEQDMITGPGAPSVSACNRDANQFVQLGRQGTGLSGADSSVLECSTSRANMLAESYLSGCMPSSPHISPIFGAPLASQRLRSMHNGEAQRAASKQPEAPEERDSCQPDGQIARGQAERLPDQQGATSWAHAVGDRSTPPSPFLAAQASVEPRSASSHTDYGGGDTGRGVQASQLAAAAAAAVQAVGQADAQASTEQASGLQPAEPSARRAVLSRFDTAYRRNVQPDQANLRGGSSTAASEAGSRSQAASSDGESGTMPTPDSSAENLSAAAQHAGLPGTVPPYGPSGAVPIPATGAAGRPPPAGPTEFNMVRLHAFLPITQAP